jgi:hypothetical protein
MSFGISSVALVVYTANVLVLFVFFAVIGSRNYSLLVSNKRTFFVVITILLIDTTSYFPPLINGTYI